MKNLVSVITTILALVSSGLTLLPTDEKAPVKQDRQHAERRQEKGQGKKGTGKVHREVREEISGAFAPPFEVNQRRRRESF